MSKSIPIRHVVLGIEATGVDPAEGHRVIEIAAVELIDRRTTGKSRHYYINPRREIDPGAQCVHGITWEFLKDKPEFREIAQDFIDFVLGAELLVHNIPFHVAFLNSELGLLGFEHLEYICPRIIDTLQMARALRPGQSNSIDALCRAYSIDASQSNMHGAVLDTHLLAQIYLEISHQAGISPNHAKGNRMTTKELSGILAATDEIINKHLGDGKHGFRHGILGKKLTTTPEEFSPRKLLIDLINQIERNLKTARNPASGITLGNSSENWRKVSPADKHEKRKPERDLEHKLANEVGSCDDNWTWWNQMPVASGLVGHRSDRTRAVDLVSNSIKDPKHYRLIELKLTRSAGSPLFALMEIVQYGLIYFVLRKNQGTKWLNGVKLNAPIFEANRIELCVLAPGNYYAGYELAWLEHGLKDALAEICEEQFGKDLAMSLTSYSLSMWPGSVPSDQKTLKSFLTDWKKVY